jgi:quinohemoprotein ethanol dehydrogenase
MRRKLTTLAAACAALLLAGCSGSGTPQSDAGLGASDDWTAVGGAADEAGYSHLTEIDSASISKLGLAWSLDLPGEVTLEATPLAVGGTLYFTGSYAKVYAVDGASGKLLWQFDPETWKRDPAKMHFSFGANRGAAYENGKIFAAALDGRLYALDAKTGKELWHADTIPPGKMMISTGAPRTMNGKVIIGNGGADFGARGYVTAYDSETGKQLWRFYTVPASPDENKGDAAMELAAKTWGPDFWQKTGGGGTVWNGMTFDVELNRIYLGVGNAGPYDSVMRDPGSKGDNLFTSSIVALDANTGKYVWHYQQNPREAWDYKSTPNMVMATLALEGKPTKVLMQMPTNGFFYVIDRMTGKPISAEKATLVTWAKSIDMKTGRPVEEPGIRYENNDSEIWPGAIGGHNWQAMSYSPKTGLVYIPVHQIGTRFSRGAQSNNAFDVMGLKVEPIIKQPGDGKGTLVAWDPVRQREVWSVKRDVIWNGGTLATAGGLVFQGTADGFFNAYDAGNGKEVWRFNAGLGIIAAPMSYRAGGKQYVSVLVGYGGTTAAYGEFLNVGWKYGAQPRRLLTFAIGGTATIPASALPDKKVHALDDAALALNEADVKAGWALSVRCAACHGVGMQSAGSPGPDLRESTIALQLDSLSQLLKTGALLDRGMPRFEMLSDTEIRQLHAYIRARARESLGARKADNSTPAPVRL